MKRAVALILSCAVILSCLLLTACGGKKYETLEEYYKAEPEELTEIFSELKGKSTEMISASGKVSGNELICDYKFTSKLTDKQIESVISQADAKIEGLTESSKKLITSLGKSSGVKDITVTVNYLNNDGSDIWTHTFGK